LAPRGGKIEIARKIRPAGKNPRPSETPDVRPADEVRLENASSGDLPEPGEDGRGSHSGAEKRDKRRTNEGFSAIADHPQKDGRPAAEGDVFGPMPLPGEIASRIGPKPSRPARVFPAGNHPTPRFCFFSLPVSRDYNCEKSTSSGIPPNSAADGSHAGGVFPESCRKNHGGNHAKTDCND
jgi:hypothetical protein